ncbi:hypothetical protein B0T09DRAFT_325290 [Sordaria sp. MPI-SDFR-AT-0083]|nr:hypothetical protein B0T09DRAFT_325290 [Sordaria sp. MPI-SDFR-AT-0083]
MHSTNTYDVRRGKRIPKLLTAYFPNYMDRFEALLALMRHSKAAVADLIAESYMDRCVHNPVTELDLSSNHTNKFRNFNKDVKAAARFSGRTITENGITRIYDVAGNLVKQFCRPEKRPLSELLGNRLAAIAKPKRDKTRTTSGPTSGQQQQLGIAASATRQKSNHTGQCPTPGHNVSRDDQYAVNNQHPTADQNLLPGGQSVFSNQFPTTEQDLLVSGLSHSNNQYTPDQSPRFNQQAYGSDNYFTPDCHQHALVGEQLVQH